VNCSAFIINYKTSVENVSVSFLIFIVVSIVRFTIRIVRYETIHVPGDTNRELYRELYHFYSRIVLVSYDTSSNRVNHDSIHDTNLPQIEALIFPPFIFRTLKLINVTY